MVCAMDPTSCTKCGGRIINKLHAAREFDRVHQLKQYSKDPKTAAQWAAIMEATMCPARVVYP